MSLPVRLSGLPRPVMLRDRSVLRLLDPAWRDVAA